MTPVTWLNCLQMPKEREEVFIEYWLRNFVPHFQAKPGFISYRMYRNHTIPNRFAFINLTLWESVEHIKAAHDDTFRALRDDPAMADIEAFPGVYELCSEG